ncbi:MAG: hypothetical protein U0694_13890 [Anaerolineae bacterium]
MDHRLFDRRYSLIPCFWWAYGGSPVNLSANSRPVFRPTHGAASGRFSAGLVGFVAPSLVYRRFLLSVGICKFQVGMPFAAILWLLADITWRDRLRVLVIPAVVVLLSFVIYPNWPLQILTSLRDYPANDWGSIALWRWIGPLALLIWIPPLILNLSRQQRLIALVCAITMGFPYFQQNDLIILFVLPVGWLPLLGNLGMLYNLPQFGVAAWQALWIVPFIIYLRILLPVMCQQGRLLYHRLYFR